MRATSLVGLMCLCVVGLPGCGAKDNSSPASANASASAPLGTSARRAEGPTPNENAKETMDAASTPKDDLRWPPGCLIENVAPHPKKPLVAVACTNGEAEVGAVVVVDARSGALRSLAMHEGYVGWSGAGLLQWHPDGERIVSNIDTNGIGLFGPDAWEASLFPDDGRDHGVQYVWTDASHLYVDTGHLVQFVKGETRFRFPESEARWVANMRWNAKLGAIVGIADAAELVAYDPVAKRTLFSQRIVPEGKGHLSLSSDGHFGVWRVFGIHPGPDHVTFFSADDGEVASSQTTTSPRIDQLYWGPAAKLAVTSYVHHIGGDPTDRAVDLYIDGKRTTTIPLGQRRPRNSGPDEAGAVAWSPDGNGIAVLLDGHGVVVHDARTGASLATFEAPAPKVPAKLPDYISREEHGGLVWVGADRLVRVGPHFVTVWSLTGEKIAEYVVPE